MKRVLPFMAALLLCACSQINSLLHDGEVVASVGEHKLYSSELAGFIPSEISTQDSIRLAESYIETWTRDMKFVDLAERELSKEEKDVSRELEEYKRSLLRYRYEQKYINQRLDTAITDTQVEEYYKAHLEMFRPNSALVKARYAVISSKSTHLAALKKMMSDEGDDTGDISIADSLAYAYAIKYTDFGARWTDIKVLAREMDMEPARLLSSVHQGFVQVTDEDKNLRIAYIAGISKSGEPAPLEYCSTRIKDIILSNRKQALLAALEQELMKKSD